MERWAWPRILAFSSPVSPPLGPIQASPLAGSLEVTVHGAGPTSLRTGFPGAEWSGQAASGWTGSPAQMESVGPTGPGQLGCGEVSVPSGCCRV